MKQCELCNKELNDFRNANAKYCVDCREVKRKEVQRINRLNRKKRMQSDDADYICDQIYKKYKIAAKQRNLKFDIPLKMFKMFFRTDCYYCGDKMENVGFDRIDNSAGYLKDNVKPCCTTCNLMKHSSDHDEFIERCKKIAEKFGSSV